MYGPDFADAYRRYWHHWGLHLWPFLQRRLAGRTPADTHWLDLGCGAGSLLEILCREGYPCTGLDVSPHQLAQARAVAPSAELIEGDLRRLQLARRFDVITCLFDTLNYLRGPREVAAVLRRVRRHLADDGLFVFDVNTPRGMRDRWPGEWVIREPERVVCVIGSYDDDRRTGRTEILGFIRAGRCWRRFDEEHVQVGLLREELDAAALAAGFAARVYDGEKLGRLPRDPRRLLYVCRPLRE